mmetsp:Transcript_125004/g.400504  ORF Transcript_125004/g.400504 Transcript_125004/m.400504 type:complete len:118 (-) Transcript_125004:115-468(-)
MLAGLFSIWGVSLPTACAFGFGAKLELPGLWDGLTLGYFTYAVLLLVVFRRSDWSKLVEEARARSERCAPLAAAADGAPPATGAAAATEGCTGGAAAAGTSLGPQDMESALDGIKPT